MKHLVRIFALLLAFSGALAAQSPAPKPTKSTAPLSAEREATARQATDALATKYTLSADQAKQMYTVQVRKQRNLAEIESLKTTNLAQYQAKVGSIQRGTLAGIRRILNNKAQVDLYQQTQAGVRNQKAVKRKELMAQKASKTDIEAALLDIYAE
jgi:hypothetical protein